MLELAPQAECEESKVRGWGSGVGVGPGRAAAVSWWKTIVA